MEILKPTSRTCEFDENKAKHLCSRIASSNDGIRKIAPEVGIAPSSVYIWLITHPSFAEQYARARELQQELMAEEILEIAEETPICEVSGEGWSKTMVDNAGVQRNRLRVETRKWLMSKLAPKKYGDKLAVEHGLESSLADRLDSARKRLESGD